MTMMKTYTVVFHGSYNDVQMMVRTFDHIFRSMYNVHGGKREACWNNEEGYNQRMSYTANWEVQFWNPECEKYTWKFLVEMANARLNAQHLQWSEAENDGKAWYEVE